MPGIRANWDKPFKSVPGWCIAVVALFLCGSLVLLCRSILGLWDAPEEKWMSSGLVAGFAVTTVLLVRDLRNAVMAHVSQKRTVHLVPKLGLGHASFAPPLRVESFRR